MSQAPTYQVANASGAAVRASLNSILAAMLSQNSGGSAPAETYPFMFWADTANDRLMMRNEADTAWLTLPISITASETVPDVLTVLGHLVGRSYLRLGADGAEWEMDPAAASAGDTLVIGPRESAIVQPDQGISIDRATGKVSVGNGSTAGAADHLDVFGGVKVNGHGVTFPDGTKGPTAGVVNSGYDSFDGGAAVYATTAWQSLGANLRVSISPQSAYSKLVVMATFCGACEGHGFWSVLRNGNPVGVSSAQSDEINAHGDLIAFDRKQCLVQSTVFVDTPQSVMEQVYEIGLRAYTAANPVIVNRGYDIDGAADELAGICHLQVLEIGGAE